MSNNLDKFEEFLNSLPPDENDWREEVQKLLEKYKAENEVEEIVVQVSMRDEYDDPTHWVEPVSDFVDQLIDDNHRRGNSVQRFWTWIAAVIVAELVNANQIAKGKIPLQRLLTIAVLYGIEAAESRPEHIECMEGAGDIVTG